jgi:hypothetical protein
MGEMLRCHHCGDLIGVYEPLVMLHDDRVHETSRAAERLLSSIPGAVCFHRACYELRGEEHTLTG